jgi:hypothetical protein
VLLKDSFHQEPVLGALGMLAWCHEQQGRIATAWREYSQAADIATRQRDLERASVARQRAAALQPRLSTLRIEVPAPASGITVTCDGALVDELSWGRPIAVDPGDVLLIARAPGRVAWSRLVSIPEQPAALLVEVPLLAPLAPPAPARPAPVAPAREQDMERAREWKLPLAAATVAGVSLTAAAWLGARAWSKNQQSKLHCDPSHACDPTGGELRDEARASATAANVAFGVGVASVVTGGVLWWLAPPRQPDTRAKLRMQPALGLRSAGLQVDARF